ncbi:MAG TPA: hypothetical protein DCE41_07355 [Cytophagales bacterium]|nr:hypothetical protein [Cytophagales bacterium]
MGLIVLSRQITWLYLPFACISLDIDIHFPFLDTESIEEAPEAFQAKEEECSLRPTCVLNYPVLRTSLREEGGDFNNLTLVICKRRKSRWKWRYMTPIRG